MKNRLYNILFSTLAVASVAFVSCQGDGSSELDAALTLETDKSEIIANNMYQAIFTVKQGAAAAGKGAEVLQIAENGKAIPVESGKFSTLTPGSYRFIARQTQNGKMVTTDTITVKAIEVPKEIYFRRMFTQQFTSTGCVNCPTLAKNLTSLQKMEAWQDRIVRASFHMNFNGSDPMHLAITEQYLSRYLKLQGLPAMVLDLNRDTYVISGTPEIEEQMQRVLKDYPATCGVAVESKFDDATRKLDVTINVKASWANDYRLLVFLVESDLIDYQIGQGSIYQHNDVVRYSFSSSLTGDKLGIIEAGSEVTTRYSTTLDSKWNATEMRVVVCVLGKVTDMYFGSNSAECALINGSTPYKMNVE